jgi:peroxiredoxin Q/BCP
MKSSLHLLTVIALTIGGLAQADESPRPAATSPPAVGNPLPAFELPDHGGQPWKSAEHVGKEVLVFYFYPGDFTGGCIKQVEAYRDGLTKIEELGAVLIGVSGDEAATHKLFREAYGLKHTLLADTQGDVAKLLGIPVSGSGRVPVRGPDRMPLRDAAGEPIVIKRNVTLARWTIVVDRQGNIASVRKIVDPATDQEEVRKIVAELAK